MPKVLRARRPVDSAEERQLRKLAGSKRAPAEQVARARTIVQSWDGAETATIAARLGCHPQTVRDRIARFNAGGIESVVYASSGGRKPRLTERQRREIVALVERLSGPQPSEHVVTTTVPGANGAIAVRRSSTWSLDSLVAAARSRGIEVGRSQLRRIMLASGIQWHPTYSWRAGQMPTPKHEGPRPPNREDVPAGG
jgi:transposase